MALPLSQTILAFSLNEEKNRLKDINNLAAMHCHVLIILFKHKEIIFIFTKSLTSCCMHAAVPARFINYRFFIAGQRKMSFI
jgi:hypothetical protein